MSSKLKKQNVSNLKPKHSFTRDLAWQEEVSLDNAIATCQKVLEERKLQASVKLTLRMQQAINLASRLHQGQVRKSDDGLPYISHPFSVAWILSNYTDDEDIIIAGLLHDVLEDVKGYYYEDLKRDFGDRVAEIVKGVTEDKDPNVKSDSRATWQERKTKYLDGLKNDSDESLLVCAADKIHNLQSMIDAYQEKGEALWNDFNSPKEKKLWLYEEITKFLKEKLNNSIVEELEAVYQEAEKALLK